MAIADHQTGVQVHPTDRRPPARWQVIRTIGLAVGGVAMAGMVIGAVRLHQFAADRDPPVPAPAPTPLASVSDLRPVTVTITTPAWTKERYTVTVDTVRSDFTLWRQMHFNDWDLIDPGIRTPALRAMIRAHAEVLTGPRTWREMTPDDWDQVPQPVRAMAYLRMIWYWAVAEDVGSELGLRPRALASAIAAIVMAESWFEHRAFNENQWGNRDLGLAQCSDYCRAEIDAMYEEGELSFSPTEAEYLNPWIAARVATVWFKRELANAAGDVDLAIRGYHRGIKNAMDEKGDAYVARVRRLRERYIRAQTVSPTWRLLTEEIGRQ